MAARAHHKGHCMRRTLVTAIALALAGTGSVLAAPAPAAASMTTAPEVKDATTQLPRTVRPVHYDVAVVPHAGTMTFDGHVAIMLDVLEPTASITVNAVDRIFANDTLAGLAGSGRTALVPKVSIDADAQTATFTVDKPLAPGRYT